MSKFKSALLLRDGTLRHSPFTDAHDHLVAMYGFTDANRFIRNWAKVEYIPPQNSDDLLDYLNLDAYEVSFYGLEGPPIWLNDDIIARARVPLQTLVERMIISEKVQYLLGGQFIIAPGAKVHVLNFARAIILGGSVENIDGGEIDEIRGGHVREIPRGYVHSIHKDSVIDYSTFAM